MTFCCSHTVNFGVNCIDPVFTCVVAPAAKNTIAGHCPRQLAGVKTRLSIPKTATFKLNCHQHQHFASASFFKTNIIPKVGLVFPTPNFLCQYPLPSMEYLASAGQVSQWSASTATIRNFSFLIVSDFLRLFFVSKNCAYYLKNNPHEPLSMMSMHRAMLDVIGLVILPCCLPRSPYGSG